MEPSAAYLRYGSSTPAAFALRYAGGFLTISMAQLPSKQVMGTFRAGFVVADEDSVTEAVNSEREAASFAVNFARRSSARTEDAGPISAREETGRGLVHDGRTYGDASDEGQHPGNRRVLHRPPLLSQSGKFGLYSTQCANPVEDRNGHERIHFGSDKSETTGADGDRAAHGGKSASRRCGPERSLAYHVRNRVPLPGRPAANVERSRESSMHPTGPAPGSSGLAGSWRSIANQPKRR